MSEADPDSTLPTPVMFCSDCGISFGVNDHEAITRHLLQNHAPASSTEGEELEAANKQLQSLLPSPEPESPSPPAVSDVIQVNGLFLCSLCDYATTLKQNLTVHAKRVHIRLKNYG